MKVAGIVGSRRKNGNTSILIQEALKPFKKAGIETELLYLGDYKINPCNGCEGCRKTYKCVINDDMEKIYSLVLESDALILGSPTYFYNLTSDVKNMLDRLYCFEVFDSEDRSVWMGINEASGGKYASVIAVCEQHSAEDMGFTADAMKLPLQALGYRVVDIVKALGLFKTGEALLDNDVLSKAEKSGDKLLKYLKLRKKLESELNRRKHNQIS